MISKRIVLHFPDIIVDQPIIYRLVKDYDLQFSILKAQITPGKKGLLVMELRGEDRNYERGLQYLRDMDVSIQPLAQDIVRNDARCTHCGVCVPLCPTDALTVDPSSRKVIFDNEACVACEYCVKICPLSAMEVHF